MTDNGRGSPLGRDPDSDGSTLEMAVRQKDFPTVLSLLSCYRSWAAYHEGRCVGMADTIGYLEGRIARLEAREQDFIKGESNRDGGRSVPGPASPS